MIINGSSARKWSGFSIAAALLLLGLVYPFPHLPHLPERFIKIINGAHRWFILPGGIRLQPSEFAKIALIILLAWYGDRYQRQMTKPMRGIILPGVLIALMLALIFIEPDRGTTVLLAAVSGSMLLLAGVQWKYIVPPVVLAAAALTVSILHDPMRMKRIFSWLDLEQHKEGVGYQAYQAMIALGSGGWFGLGLGNGRQKLGFVPEHHTDFIFSIIGEELGLIATAACRRGVCCPRPVRHLHRAQRPRHLWHAARGRRHAADRFAGRHQYRRRHQRAAEQGPAAAVHQLRRLKPAGHARVRRHFVQRCAPGAPPRKNFPRRTLVAAGNPFAARAA